MLLLLCKDDMEGIGGVLEKLSLRTTLRLDSLVSPGNEALKWPTRIITLMNGDP